MRYVITMFILLFATPLRADVHGINADLLSSWYACSTTMVHDAGLNDWAIPLTYKRYSHNRDPKFLILLHAVIHAESRFRSNVISGAQAYGLMQITQVALQEAIIQCGYSKIPLNKLLDPAINIKYGSCYLDFLLKSTKGDTDRALIIYNGGFRQLSKYDQSQPIANETANYVVSVHRALNLCKGVYNEL